MPLGGGGGGWAPVGGGGGVVSFFLQIIKECGGVGGRGGGWGPPQKSPRVPTLRVTVGGGGDMGEGRGQRTY
jgi:hypothetical protein